MLRAGTLEHASNLHPHVFDKKKRKLSTPQLKNIFKI